jgi:nucleotide-binding universal stress UspA family protein
MRILLPVYGTDDTKLIVDFVCNYRWPPHPTFKLVHVVGGSNTDMSVLMSEASAESLILEVVKRLSSLLPAAEVTWEIVTGEAVLEIINMANDWEADMIVMGYRKRNSMHDFVIASVSKAVAMQAPCSVAIISPPKTKSTGALEHSIATTT